MKKYLLLLSLTTILSSCALSRAFIYENKTIITDYETQMELVKINFPELYNLYIKGDIIINEVFTYDKEGNERVHLNYRYR